MPRWLEGLFTTCGTLSCQHGPIDWVGLHRHHHLHSDDPADHHNSHLGFWWSHFGWMLRDVPAQRYVRQLTPDMQRVPYYRWLNRNFLLLQLPLAAHPPGPGAGDPSCRIFTFLIRSPFTVMNTPSMTQLDITSPNYRAAFSRINGLVVVGEGLADRHFRLLARAIPEDQQELERLAAMEGRHASDFVGCGRNLGVKPDVGLARQLFAPLHALFLERDRLGDLAGCLVIQGLVVECFAVAAYRHYLPVADAYAAPITAAVIADEGEHLGYAEHWLRERFAAVETSAAAIAKRALPITLSILQSLAADLQAIGMDPIELVASFSELFQSALETIGFEPPAARRILAGAAAAMV